MVGLIRDRGEAAGLGVASAKGVVCKVMMGCGCALNAGSVSRGRKSETRDPWKIRCFNDLQPASGLRSVMAVSVSQRERRLLRPAMGVRSLIAELSSVRNCRSGRLARKVTQLMTARDRSRG